MTDRLITEPLSKAVAEELFYREAIYMFGADAIPEYRIYELFGEPAAEYVERNRRIGGQLVNGRDCNTAGDCSESRPARNYFRKAGFMQLVTEHNYLIMVEAYKESEGGAIADKYWQRRRGRSSNSLYRY